VPRVVVFDTNILLSGVGWRGNPYRCLELARSGVVEGVTCQELLEELAEKLQSKWKVAPRTLSRVITATCSRWAAFGVSPLSAPPSSSRWCLRPLSNPLGNPVGQPAGSGDRTSPGRSPEFSSHPAPASLPDLRPAGSMFRPHLERRRLPPWPLCSVPSSKLPSPAPTCRNCQKFLQNQCPPLRGAGQPGRRSLLSQERPPGQSDLRAGAPSGCPPQAIAESGSGREWPSWWRSFGAPESAPRRA
jgi:hypothetical protein